MATKTKFALKTIGLLDFGIIDEAFTKDLQRVVQDCLERPMDGKPRKVSIVFSIAPEKKPDMRDCDSVTVECEVTSTVPKKRTQVYTMTPTVGGQLLFNPDTPEDPDQATLYDDEERKLDNGQK